MLLTLSTSTAIINASFRVPSLKQLEKKLDRLLLLGTAASAIQSYATSTIRVPLNIPTSFYVLHGLLFYLELQSTKEAAKTVFTLAFAIPTVARETKAIYSLLSEVYDEGMLGVTCKTSITNLGRSMFNSAKTAVNTRMAKAVDAIKKGCRH